MAGTIKSSIDDGVLRISIDNPARRNAVDDAMLHQLHTEVRNARSHDVGCVVLRGEGTRAFCAGFDLTQASSDDLNASDRERSIEALCREIEMVDVVVLAALNGDTVGLGLEIASACDLRIARHGVRVALPAVRIGVSYRPDGAQRIMRATGANWFKLLLHTGQLVDVNRLAPAGFVAESHPADSFDTAVDVLAANLANAGRTLQRHNKQLTAARRDDVDDVPSLG